MLVFGKQPLAEPSSSLLFLPNPTVNLNFRFILLFKTFIYLLDQIIAADLVIFTVPILLVWLKHAGACRCEECLFGTRRDLEPGLVRVLS